MRDIDAIIKSIADISPTVRVQQLSVSHPADDDGVWFFARPDSDLEVQVESSTAMCPFLIETDENDLRFTANTIAEAVRIVADLLHLPHKKHDNWR